jgi:hypothetical protein
MTRIRFLVGANILFTTTSRQALEHTQPPLQSASTAPSSGVKQLEHEADHTPPLSVLFLYDLLNYDVSSSVCIMSNDRRFNE